MRKLFIAAATAMFALSGAAHAAVVGIPFTMTGDDTLGTGAIPGTVTGTIFLDGVDLTSQAISSVAIDLDPSVNGPGPFPSAKLIDPVIPGGGGGFWTVTTNTVTFDGSVVTALMFDATWDDDDKNSLDRLRLNISDASGLSENFLTINGHPDHRSKGASAAFLGNNDGLAGLGPLAVPIPAALPLFLSGLAFFGFVARRRRQSAEA